MMIIAKEHYFLNRMNQTSNSKMSQKIVLKNSFWSAQSWTHCHAHKVWGHGQKKRPRPYTYNMFSNMFWVVKKAISAISTTCFCTKCNKCQGPTTLTLLLSFCLNGFVLESLMTFIIADKISGKPWDWYKKIREGACNPSFIRLVLSKIQIQRT